MMKWLARNLDAFSALAIILVGACLFVSYEPQPEPQPAGYPPETMFEDADTELSEEEEAFERSLVEEEE